MTATVDPAADAVALARDGVLRGLAHDLSNRTGTIGAVAEALVAADPTSRLARALHDEAARLDALLRLLRLLPADLDRASEPVRPADLVADAAALVALHPSGRDRTVTFERGDDAPPVRVHVPGAVHALLARLVDAAARDAGATLAVTWRERDGDVVLSVGDAVLALPTLAAARAREARA